MFFGIAGENLSDESGPHFVDCVMHPDWSFVVEVSGVIFLV